MTQPTPGQNLPSNMEPTIVSQTHQTAPPAPQPKGRFGRRALLATASLGVCAGAVALTPAAAQQVQQYTQDQLNDYFHKGFDAGRQALLGELGQIEGVSLDGAIGVAELTRLAVLYIVVPLSRLYATVTGDLLAILASGVQKARSLLGAVHITVGALDTLYSLLTTWQTNVTALPKKLGDYANADILSAEAYLRALQRKIVAEQQSTPTPSSTSTGSPSLTPTTTPQG